MAKGVRKTHLKHLQTLTDFYREVEGKEPNEDALKKIEEKALAMTRKDTHQAMEGFIHNLNTMHSRGGNQVVFSSINYGTDTSAEGRMVIEELLKATIEGLGSRGEVPVFPIQIFKIKDGVSYSEEDYKKAMANFDDAVAGKIQFKAPNFDLFLKACRTTAKALFPNFMFWMPPIIRMRNGMPMIRNAIVMSSQPWDVVHVYMKM